MNITERVTHLLEVLNEGLYEREEVIAVSLLSALAGQNIFLFGPPGTAKSLISRRLSKAFETRHYFEHLMQKFSTPEEVFGPISIKELKQDNYLRKTEGFLPEAEFAFLDEIWKSSPAILNTLLTIINEKKFKNGFEVKNVPLKTLISASNETPPENQGLDALYDRFLTRLYVPALRDRDNFETLLQHGSTSDKIEIPAELTIDNEELCSWQEHINTIVLSRDSLSIINGIRHKLADYNSTVKSDDQIIYVSDRRWQKAATLLKASAYFCGRKETNLADCLLLSVCLWTHAHNRQTVQSLVEATIRENGFLTRESLSSIDTKKDTLENKIKDTIFYTSDIYQVHASINDEAYFENTIIIDKNTAQQDQQTFLIPKSKMDDQEKFNPIDKQGNTLKWIECEFNGQGTCSIKANKNARANDDDLNRNNCWKNYALFKPEILFNNGERRKDIDMEFVASLTRELKELSESIEDILTTLKNQEKNFVDNIETPFLSRDDLNIPIDGINQQIENFDLRLKDCERIKNLVD